ncbi:hypothetical protein MSAN_00181600 [Mycena sanguinolenta]|uniref:F-box domain-containing protein n=1 Tax=Mycena sanguinolenta TaxID=230812 RepID=A0A8H7DJE0_9AGAR|nr:hypothetical protein MSAN_00181600 [Mycena sanguinolenta]
MPSRNTRRRLESPPADENSKESDPPSKPCLADEWDPNAGLFLVQLPPELFDAIIENYGTLPCPFFYSTHNIPELKYYERNDALTALSQTCRALRGIILPRLWARLDICRVPERARLTWYKYTMQAIERKANGIAVSPVRHHVRMLTLMFSKSQPEAALAALWNMLPKLPNLRTIQVIICKTPGLAKSLTDSKLELPNVTTLFLPNEASFFQRICPNATHLCCVGGSGASLMSALTEKTEVFDGMVDWTDLKLQVVGRLLKNAPNLRTLEFRRPVNAGLGIASQNTAPAEWKQIIPKLAPLKKLTKLILTFPAAEEITDDTASIEAARTLMRKSVV